MTIIGKILIVKTFGVSNFVYLMGSIGMPDWVINELNTCFFTFLWKNNNGDSKRVRERVKRQVLYNDIYDGGLSMVNLRDFQDGFILGWVEKLLTENENAEWTKIPIDNFKKVGGKEIFETETAVKDMKGKHDMYTHFWVNALDRWQKLKNNNTSGEITTNEFLFNNHRVLYKNNFLLLLDCVKFDILRVGDMLNEDFTIMNFNEFSRKYPNLPNMILNFKVLYNALIHLQIKRSRHEGNENKIFFRDVEIGQVGRKAFMKFIKKVEKPFILDMWKRKFDFEIEMEHWTLPYIVTKEIRLRVLQWKILHNVYPTNIHLQKMKLKETEICDWCNGIDYSEHAFYECHKIRPLWYEIEKVFSAKTNVKHKITRDDAMFGISKYQTTMKTSCLKLLNHIMLIGKLAISKFRFAKSLNVIEIFHKELNFHLSLLS